MSLEAALNDAAESVDADCKEAAAIVERLIDPDAEWRSSISNEPFGDGGRSVHAIIDGFLLGAQRALAVRPQPGRWTPKTRLRYAESLARFALACGSIEEPLGLMGADWYAPGCWDGLVDDLDRADWNEANDETRGYVVRTVANRGARASGPRQPVYAYEHAAVIIIRDILDRIVAEFKARADLDTGGDR